MSKILIDREVVEQALAALRLSTPDPRENDDDYASQGWKEHSEAITALFNRLRRRLAEPVQEPEPVARFDERIGCPTLLPGAPLLNADQLLYTAAPTRRPLTDGEIDALWRKFSSEEGFTTAQFVRNFARNIERKITGGNDE